MAPTSSSTAPPNILILSNPRSGSSWLGSAIANSPIVDYRREPILQHRLGRVSDAFGASSGLTLEEKHDLTASVTAAFADRQRPTVIVKEVTPLLIDDLLRDVDPQVLYVRRHPLAMAQSHLGLGWPPSAQRLNRAGIGVQERGVLLELWESGSDISRLVAYFAAVESSVRARLEDIGAIAVGYEDLKAGDLGDVAPLFASLGISARDLSAPGLDAERADAYGVGDSRKRTSASPPSPVDLEQARLAWLAFSPSSYTNDADWVL